MNTPDADQTTSPTPKPVIYQMLPRLFANRCPDPVPGGTMERNGAGKLNDINSHVLGKIR